MVAGKASTAGYVGHRSYRLLTPDRRQRELGTPCRRSSVVIMSTQLYVGGHDGWNVVATAGLATAATLDASDGGSADPAEGSAAAAATAPAPLPSATACVADSVPEGADAVPLGAGTPSACVDASNRNRPHNLRHTRTRGTRYSVMARNASMTTVASGSTAKARAADACATTNDNMSRTARSGPAPRGDSLAGDPGDHGREDKRQWNCPRQDCYCPLPGAAQGATRTGTAGRDSNRYEHWQCTHRPRFPTPNTHVHSGCPTKTNSGDRKFAVSICSVANPRDTSGTTAAVLCTWPTSDGGAPGVVATTPTMIPNGIWEGTRRAKNIWLAECVPPHLSPQISRHLYGATATIVYVCTWAHA